MKDLIHPMLKASLVRRLFFFIFSLLSFSSGAQNKITVEEYNIINSLFNEKKTHIYELTLFDKGWSNNFEHIERIFSNVGIPTKISDKELEKKLNKKILSKIHSSINKLEPYRLSQKHIGNSIELSARFDDEKAFKDGVFRISKPIIVDDRIAVVKKVSISESPIFILEKIRGEWQIIYTFYDWYILN